VHTSYIFQHSSRGVSIDVSLTSLPEDVLWNADVSLYGIIPYHTDAGFALEFVARPNQRITMRIRLLASEDRSHSPIWILKEAPSRLHGDIVGDNVLGALPATLSASRRFTQLVPVEGTIAIAQVLFPSLSRVRPLVSRLSGLAGIPCLVSTACRLTGAHADLSNDEDFEAAVLSS